MYEYIKNDIPLIDLEETTEENSETIETTEETTSEIIYITTEGQPVDTNIYFSASVNGADLNDIYSVALSTRNIVLLFFLFFLFFKVKNIIHVTLSKLFNIGK